MFLSRFFEVRQVRKDGRKLIALKNKISSQQNKKCSKISRILCVNFSFKFLIESLSKCNFKSLKSAIYPNEILNYSSLCTAPTPMALFIFSHIKKRIPTIHDENKNSPHIFT